MSNLLSPDGVLSIDPASRRIVEASPSAAAILRETPDALIGRSLDALRLWATPSETEIAFATITQTGIARFDACGEDSQIEAIGAVTCDQGRSIVRLHLRDLAPRRQAERERESERRREWQAEVFSVALDCVITMDAEGRITGFNPAAEATLGYSREEALGQSVMELVVPEGLRQRHHQGIAQYLRTGRSPALNRRIEGEALRADGTPFPMELIVTAAHDGDQVSFTGYLRDITDRKRTENALRQSLERLELVSQATHDAVWDWHIGSNLHWNQGFSTLFGYEEEEIEPGIESWTSRVHPDDQERVHRDLQRVIDGQVDGWQAEYRFLRKDGSVAHVLDRGHCLRDEEGRAFRMIGAMIDLSERKEAEEALRASEAGYRSMFTANPHPMWVYDIETLAFLSVNDASVARYGYSPEEFSAMTIYDIHPLEEAEALHRIVPDLRGNGRLEGLWRHRTKDGEVLHVEIASHPLAWEGRPARLVLANDVTERKRSEDRLLAAHAELESRVHSRTAEVRRANVALRNEIIERRQAEEELRLSEARYRAIVEDQTEMICRYTLDGTLTFVNEAHCRYFQQSADEIIGKSFFQFLSPGQAEIVRQRVTALGPDNPVISFELRNDGQNGEVRWQQWTERYLVDGNGDFVSIQAVGRDITAQKLAELELQQANEELTRNEARLLHGNSIFTELTRLHVTSDEELKTALRQITESSSHLLDAERCSIWLYNEENSHISCVDLYERPAHRHSAGMALSMKDFPNYFHHLTSRRSIVASDAHHHPATYEFSEVYLKTLDILSMLDVPIIIGGRMVGVLCCEQVGKPRRWMVEDQTFASSAASICSVALESYERTRVEEALRVARDEAETARRDAENANRAKSEFLSRMSHELRTPLNAILGFGQILEQQSLTPMQREGVAYVLKGGRHLLELINEVLDISRVEAGRMELSMEAVDVADLVEEACALVRPLGAERGIEVTPHRMGLAHHVVADRQRLRQVVFNLLSNAIKYNRREGRVEVSGELRPGDRLRIAVRDTGYGMAPEDLARLFTPFERLRATSTEIEGTGLGLAVSQRLASAMAGTLAVESTVGVGSVFYVEFPLAQCPLERAAVTEFDASSPSEPMEGSKRTVLYIEDNSSNLRLLEVFFADRGDVDLLTAKDGKTGLDRAREEEPDLILLDLHLPEMSGTEVLARLKRSALTREIPVIIVSADATPTQIDRLRTAGAEAFLTKPLNLSLFSHTLDELFARA
jgi:PAS domain S-box-containing protein